MGINNSFLEFCMTASGKNIKGFVKIISDFFTVCLEFL
jgi:hypothetical protein